MLQLRTDMKSAVSDKTSERGKIQGKKDEVISIDAGSREQQSETNVDSDKQNVENDKHCAVETQGSVNNMDTEISRDVDTQISRDTGETQMSVDTIEAEMSAEPNKELEQHAEKIKRTYGTRSADKKETKQLHTSSGTKSPDRKKKKMQEKGVTTHSSSEDVAKEAESHSNADPSPLVTISKPRTRVRNFCHHCLILLLLFVFILIIIGLFDVHVQTEQLQLFGFKLMLYWNTEEPLLCSLKFY